MSEETTTEAFNEDLVTIASSELAAIIIVMVSIFGLLANFLSIHLVLTYPHLRNSFGALCVSQSVANSGLLIIFAGWCAPMQWMSDDEMSTGLWGKIMGQLNTLFWANSVYSHLVVSLNRLFSITFPTRRLKFAGSKGTYFLVSCSWTIAAILNLPYFYRDECYIVYTPSTFTWNYSQSTCGTIIGTYLDFYLGMAVFGIIAIFDVYTIFQLRNISGAGGREVLLKRRAMEIRFFAQSCTQLLIFAYIFASFYYVSTFMTTKWQLFFTVTFSWQACHSLDGCVLLIFHWRRQPQPSVSRQTMVRVASTFSHNSPAEHHS
ncbi:unnamed protein product, partial [Mesorhabditis spiculigera]